MIECVFTIDYEIYGNGEGLLSELVYEPTRELMSIFQKWNATFVVFAEALELSKMEEYHADNGIGKVCGQLRQLLDENFEIGLHLHPWWFNACRENGGWRFEWSKRNVCELPAQEMDQMVRHGIEYLRKAVGASGFAPLSFRSGLWLMQPTKGIAAVLAQRGLRIDSSVFKGGRIKDVGLDYRPALKNGYYWPFREDVNTPDQCGALLEPPIHTEMVPCWKMISGKRLGLCRKVPATGNGAPLPGRWSDYARFRYPRKLDFCRMGFAELKSVMDGILREEKLNPRTYKPIVAIGHTKDLVDFDTVSRFLGYLARNGIAVVNFRQVLQRLSREHV